MISKVRPKKIKLRHEKDQEPLSFPHQAGDNLRAKLIPQNVRPLYFRSDSAYTQKQTCLTLLSGSSTFPNTSPNTVLFSH